MIWDEIHVHRWHWGAVFMIVGVRVAWGDRADRPGIHRPDAAEIGVTTSSSPDGW